MEERKTQLSDDLRALRIKRGRKFQPKTKPKRPARKWLLCAAIVTPLIVVAAFVVPRVNLSVRSSLGLGTRTVRVATAAREGRGGPRPLLSAGGYVIARNRVEVGSKITGRVVALEVEEGNVVSRGQVTALLDDSEMKAQLREAQAKMATAKAQLAEAEAGSRPQEVERDRAEMDRAEADLNNASVGVKRTESLVRNGVVAQQELDDDRSRYEMALARYRSAKKSFELTKAGTRREAVEVARAALQQAASEVGVIQAQFDNTIIRAPISGTVLERYVSTGEMVTTGFTSERGAKQALLSIADLSDLQVEADISEADIAKVSLQQPATVVPDAYPDHSYRAVVDYIASAADRQKATVQVKVRVLGPDRYLRPDLGAKITFYQAGAGVSGGEDVVTVPKEAVVSRDGRTLVFVVRGAQAFAQAVTTGAAEGGVVQILSGLEGGEQVVVEGQVGHGDKVVVQSQGT
jgi:HlyD family secretion protein